MMDYNLKFNFPPSERPMGWCTSSPRFWDRDHCLQRQGRAPRQGGGSGEKDVQWMRRASGVLHKEFHEREWSKKVVPSRWYNYWVNLPAKRQDEQSPNTRHWKQRHAKVGLGDGLGQVEDCRQLSGAWGCCQYFSPIHLYNAKLQAGGVADFTFPAHYNTALLVVEGSIEINGTEHAQTDQMALFTMKEETF